MIKMSHKQITQKRNSIKNSFFKFLSSVSTDEVAFISTIVSVLLLPTYWNTWHIWICSIEAAVIPILMPQILSFLHSQHLCDRTVTLLFPPLPPPQISIINKKFCSAQHTLFPIRTLIYLQTLIFWSNVQKLPNFLQKYFIFYSYIVQLLIAFEWFFSCSNYLPASLFPCTVSSLKAGKILY